MNNKGLFWKYNEKIKNIIINFIPTQERKKLKPALLEAQWCKYLLSSIFFPLAKESDQGVFLKQKTHRFINGGFFRKYFFLQLTELSIQQINRTRLPGGKNSINHIDVPIGGFNHVLVGDDSLDFTRSRSTVHDVHGSLSSHSQVERIVIKQGPQG